MKSKSPNVSVIILTYNGERYIDSLLESLSDQSFPKAQMEIVVVDNASKDNTLSIIQKKYPHIKHVALKKNVGFARGNNIGLQHAQHDLLVFLNQDTVCHRNWLSAMVAAMSDSGNIAACTSNIIPPEADEFHALDRQAGYKTLHYCDLSPFGYGRLRKNSRSRRVFTKILSGCSFAIRRKTVDELGYLFDEQFWMYAEDTDLSLRIHNLGRRICAVRDSVVFHFHHNGIQIKKGRLNLSAQAIMNRVHAFFKNMDTMEFLLFFPLLFFGGIFKILEFPLTRSRKALLFIPFGLFTMACMLLALLDLPKFAAKKRRVMKQRKVTRFPILKRTLKHSL